jgi:hypothetical protein
MHKYDEFIHKELAPKLAPGESIEVTGFLFTKSLAKVIATHGLSLIGDGYFFAALTRKRMFLIATEMGVTSLKMLNKELGEVPYSDIKSIKPSGFLNQKMLAIEVNDGKTLVFRLNSLATHYASGQKQFIESLVNFHQAATKA